MLAPTLRPDDIVLLDNLSSHKIAGIKEASPRKACSLVYLPPYSPDLNPIEQAFAKFKAALRQAAERSRDGLWHVIGRTLDRYPTAGTSQLLYQGRLCNPTGNRSKPQPAEHARRKTVEVSQPNYCAAADGPPRHDERLENAIAGRARTRSHATPGLLQR